MQIRIALFLSAISVLAMTHIVANEFYLYWIYLWLDMPVHLLGGICVALGISILPFFNIHFPQWFGRIKGYLLLVFIVGILWEVFELVNGISLVNKEDFIFDTTIDLILDLVGGAVGYYLVMKIKDF